MAARLRAPFPLALALLWVSLWEPVAPACRRATWRDQWRADLWHYWHWLRTVAKPSPSPASAWLSLAGRAWACLPHAVLLRVREWSLHMLFHDFTFAWRMLVRRPAFTAVAILILGLSIGANATIFSWVETILLKPLPSVGDVDRLVSVRGTNKSRRDLSFSYPNFTDLQAANPDGFEGLTAFRVLSLNLRTADEPMRVWGELVTPNFFDVLRVPMTLGRGFVAADAGAPGREPVAVVSYNCWIRAFGSDPAIVGRTVALNGHAFTVVGVAARGFRGSLAGLAFDVFVPITMQKAVMAGDRLPQRGNSFLEVIGRLAPGASIVRAQASANVVAARIAAEYPKYEKRGTAVIPLWKEGASGLLLPVMATLMAVVGVVLLIACANLAGLLLARAAGRQREVAVRLAIGASRGRLIRQFLIESLLLAAGGGAAGVMIAYWTSGMLASFMPPVPFPVSITASVSPPVIAFSIAITLVAAIVFGLLPAIRASRPDVAGALRDAAGSVTSGRSRGRLRQALVVSQVALSLLLLICAALFVRSLSRAQTLDPGFEMRDGLLASIDLLPNGYDAPRGVLLYQQLLQRLSTIPRVQSATLAAAMPLGLGGGGSDLSVRVDGYQARDGEEPQAYYNRVAPRYFETMGILIVRGRAIDDQDVEGHPLSVVINETMARRYWDGRDPLGSRLDFGRGPAVVVGIAKDGKYSQLNEAPRNYMYIPEYQFFRPDMILQIRTAGDLGAVLASVEAEVKRLDPNLPLFDVRTMDDHMRLTMFIPRMASTLLGLFGVLALLLAVVGLYSVVAFTVSQRTQEIGIRIALGAERGEILRMVLRQGMMLASAGLGIGIALAFGTAQVLKTQLVGLAATDPISFGATTGALFAVALAACALPAVRAAALDPLTALRRN